MCIPQGATDTPTFSFSGWIDGDEVDLESGLTFPDETMYLAITRDVVPLGDWFELSGDDRESLPMGRLVCLAHEWDEGAIQFDAVAGSTYRVYRDGSTAKPEP